MEQGIISAKFTGVKREKAKLKAVAQPFVFAEFSYIKKSDYITITTASLIDSFYPILMSYDKTICGYIILDILKSVLLYKKQENELFILTINTLKKLETNNEYITCIDFILKMFSFLGEELNLPNSSYVNIDKETGEFTEIKNQFTSPIDKKIYSVLKNISIENFDGLTVDQSEQTADTNSISVTTKNLKQLLRLLHSVITIKFGVEIKSFAMLD